LFTPHRANEGVPKADFYSVKGVIDALCPGLTWGIPATPDPRLHPTRQAEVVGLGILGVLHPDTAEACGLPADTVVAEFDLEQLAASLMAPIAYRPISRNPAVRRDLAILIDKSVPFADVLGAIERGAGDSLERHWLFDVYEGKGIPEGKHSLAVALLLRKMGENFTDEEANQVREQVVAELARLGATLR
jgi:phenylalanyl-tRNA synthetase beta chain